MSCKNLDGQCGKSWCNCDKAKFFIHNDALTTGQPDPEAGFEVGCISLQHALELEKQLAEANKAIQLSRDKWNADAHRAARLESQLVEANATSEARREAMSRMHDEMLNQAARANRNADELNEARECLRLLMYHDDTTIETEQPALWQRCRNVVNPPIRGNNID